MLPWRIGKCDRVVSNRANEIMHVRYFLDTVYKLSLQAIRLITRAIKHVIKNPTMVIVV